MKKYILILTLLLATFGLCFNALAACNLQQASQEFATFVQKKSKEDPKKFGELNSEFQKLAKTVEQLTRQGKTEEICKQYDALMAKF